MGQDGRTLRPIQVAAADDVLIRALVQHRPLRQGWRFHRLDGAPEEDALVVVDFDDRAARRQALEALRGDGFAGPAVILGGADLISTPADEALPRPVRLGQLLARIDSHGYASAPYETLSLGPYRFTPAERLLRDGASGRVVRLTELEQDLLVYLSAAQGALVGRDQLLADVWGYSGAVDSHTVETHVWRLRQKVETDDPTTRFLITEAGGYRLVSGERPGD